MAVIKEINKYLQKRLFGVGADNNRSIVTNSGNGNYGRRTNLQAYKNVVYECVSAIALSGANYEPFSYIEKNGFKERTKINHEFINVLNNPNPYLSKFDLFEATLSFMLLQGEAYWYYALGERSNKIKEIYILRADMVTPAIDKQGEIIGYIYDKGGGDKMPLTANEVEQFKLFNPNDPYRGLSVISVASDYIETEESTARFTKNFFNSNAGISGILSVGSKENPMTGEAFMKFANQWRERYSGVDSAGKTAIIRQADASFVKVGLGLNELDMQALRSMTKEDVMSAFRVPKGILGREDSAGLGRASIETLEYIFAKRTVEPYLQKIDDTLTRAVAKHYKENIKIDHESIIPQDKEFILKERQAGVDLWITRNEIRIAEQLEPKDGGDDLRVPINEIEIGSDKPDTADKSYTLKLKKSDTLIAKEKKELDIVAKENFRLSLMKNQDKYEKKYKVIVGKEMRELRRDIIKKINPKNAMLAKSVDQMLFETRQAVNQLNEALDGLVFDLYNTQGALAMQFAGADPKDFIIDKKILNFLNKNLERSNYNFIDGLSKTLGGTLAEGMQNNESLEELTVRVQGVFGAYELDGYNAERLARTETLKASNYATNYGYYQSGYVISQEWVANPNACEICEYFNGKTVKLDGNFAEKDVPIELDSGAVYVPDYETIEVPPAHANCRCTIAPVRE